MGSAEGHRGRPVRRAGHHRGVGAVVPSPSRQWVFHPSTTRRPSPSPRTSGSKPTDTDVTSSGSPLTCVGASTSPVVVPLPTWPVAVVPPAVDRTVAEQCTGVAVGRDAVRRRDPSPVTLTGVARSVRAPSPIPPSRHGPSTTGSPSVWRIGRPTAMVGDTAVQAGDGGGMSAGAMYRPFPTAPRSLRPQQLRACHRRGARMCASGRPLRPLRPRARPTTRLGVLSLRDVVPVPTSPLGVETPAPDAALAVEGARVLASRRDVGEVGGRNDGRRSARRGGSRRPARAELTVRVVPPTPCRPIDEDRAGVPGAGGDGDWRAPGPSPSPACG